MTKNIAYCQTITKLQRIYAVANETTDKFKTGNGKIS